MISDMLSKHVGAEKAFLKKWFKINDIQLVHLLVVWYFVKKSVTKLCTKQQGMSKSCNAITTVLLKGDLAIRFDKTTNSETWHRQPLLQVR